jgi:hypothetical protein
MVDLSLLSLAEDYAIKSIDPRYRPTAFTGLIFVSDVPKSNTWHRDEIKPARSSDLVESLVKLPQLERLKIRKGFWLTTGHVKIIVTRGEKLQRLNLKESGMTRGKRWAIRGTREDVEFGLVCEESASPPPA